MRHWNKKKKLCFGILIVFLAAQAIQPPKNYGSPTGPLDLTATVQVPDQILKTLKRSCYDCHSNRTNYPWYDHITPVNFWVASHINEGKKDLNFSTFKEYTKDRQFETLEAIAHSVETDEMPLDSYLFLHPDAKLSDENKKLIATWARATMDEINKLK
jgi:hypothetical protein